MSIGVAIIGSGIFVETEHLVFPALKLCPLRHLTNPALASRSSYPSLLPQGYLLPLSQIRTSTKR